MSTLTRSVLVDGLAFGEGPRWRDGRLYLSDMHSHAVLAVETDGRVTTVARHDGPVSGLGFLPDGKLIAVDMAGAVLRLEGDAFVEHADLRSLASHGVNDMIVHPGGWAYVGQFGFDREGGGRAVPSALLWVGADGSAVEAADGLMVANGMALTPDGRTLIVAESAGRRLAAFTVGDRGVLSDRRVWADLPDRHFPDGICLDAEGAVWVGAVMARRYIRVLEGGTITDTVALEDDRFAVACVLGGSDRRTLYLLTAATTGEADASRAARAARVEQVRVAVPGAGLP